SKEPGSSPFTPKKAKLDSNRNQRAPLKASAESKHWLNGPLKAGKG
ncbi:2787_t:CDS:1, partial [Dentiscutata erythropus]